jgi:hypothetical protein
MPLESNLNQSPYFDDFDEDKNFYRILFRPGRAVQARELTQIQSILQNQVDKLANEVFVDGTIVTGGGLITDKTNYVKLMDKDANGRVILLNDFYTSSQIANAYVVGQTTGMEGKLVSVVDGSEAAAPNYLTFYCHYTNSGSNNATRTFGNGETLHFYNSSNNNFIFAANTLVSNSTGFALKANIDSGTVYHKGHMIKLQPQSTIVGRYTTEPWAQIGLTTEESFINSDQDSTLLDNAAGATNYAAPGANRLKIYPRLTVKPYGYANNAGYFNIATVEGGSIVTRGGDTILPAVEDMMARRSYDTNGDYVTEPFNIRIREHLKKENSLGKYTEDDGGDYLKLVAEIERGTAYVSGKKVEIAESKFINFDKATDTSTFNGVAIGQTIGNYVIAEECVGTWGLSDFQEVDLYDSYQKGISQKNLGLQQARGVKVGTAKVRGFQWDSGYMGMADGRFRIYLFDISMNNGKSFRDVRGMRIEGTNGTRSMCDLISELDGYVKVQETNLNALVFPLGQFGTKSLTDQQFVYRTEIDSDFGTTGTATIDLPSAHPGGTENLQDTGSPLTNPDERNVIIVSRASVKSAPQTGSVTSASGTSITGSGTQFQSEYKIGDFIELDNGGTLTNHRITAIPSHTSITVANTITSAVSGSVPHRVLFPTGHIFDMTRDGATIQSTSSTQYELNIGVANLESQFASTVYFNVLRTDAVQTSKIVNKNRYVYIDTSTHSAGASGPWSLGVPDVYKIEAVYQGTDETGTDVTKNFELDDGQKDSFYDISKLVKKSDSTLSTTSKGFLVKFSYFTHNRTNGIGYLSADSYPIDDRYTANTDAVTTQEIPIFRSPTTNREFDLRDSVDFRPIKVAAVTPATTATVTSGITNPGTSTTYDVHASGSYIPTPDENFQADIEFYLPRKDRIVITKGGSTQIVKGIPEVLPRTPADLPASMTLAILDIPPYPSLSPYVSKQYKRSKYAVRMTLENNRRYTMKDLRAIEQRINNLEYYSTMNLLESTAKNQQLFNSDGVDRFKNGLFVDPMVSHAHADTANPYYKAAIDKNNGYMRPAFLRSDVKLNYDEASSTGVIQKGNMLMLDYVDEKFLDQPYASKLRNPVQELMFNWRGHVDLDPPADNGTSIQTEPEIQLDFNGFYESMERIAQEAGILDKIEWGGWNQNGKTRTKTGTQLTMSAVEETISFGNMVQSVSVRDFMRTRPIRFTGQRMRPNTRVWAYFDDEKVFEYCTPCDENFNEIGAEGDALYTDATGTCYGIFRIPEDDNLKFRIGTKRFVLMDISNPDTQKDLIGTSAHGDYSSFPLDVVQRGASVNMTVPQFGQKTFNQTQTLHTVADGDRSWWDPLAQSFTVNVSGSVDGIFVTRVDLYFGNKDSTLPITLQIREVENGFPTQTIVPNGIKTLKPASIDADMTKPVNTPFFFDSPVFLENKKEYAIVAVPGGNSDQYTLWVAQLGGMDIVRPNTLISKQTASGVLFSSSNDSTWNAIQDEDMMFDIYRARFDTGVNSGSVVLKNNPAEFFNVDEIDGGFKVGETVRSESTLTMANSDSVPVGTVLRSEYCYFANNTNGFNYTHPNFANGVVREIVSSGSGSVIVKVDAMGNFPVSSSNNANRIYLSDGTHIGTASSFTAGTATGECSFFYNIAGKLHLLDGSGTFPEGDYVRGQKSGASAVIGSYDNLPMNTVVPKVPELLRFNTSTSWEVRPTTSGRVLDNWMPASLGEENNFYDNEKSIFTKSNEPSGRSFSMRGTLSTSDDMVSPMIDLSRANAIVLGNIINNDSDEEWKNVGNSRVRYISKKVTLADGMDAEDLSVFIDAYKPRGTEVEVFARIQHGEDAEAFNDKDFTPMTQITASNTYSIGTDGADIREFQFGFSANTNGQGFLTSANNHARINTDDSIVWYRGTDGATYSGYKTFSIKIVLTASSSALVPFVDGLRAIALQK